MIFLTVLVGGIYGTSILKSKLFPQKRPDFLTHVVRFEQLPVAVVEKGTLESAENRDVICKVKAGSKGTFASSIKWVIDDGSLVTKGQLLMQLDDSALVDSRANQSIVVERARADYIKADEDYRITHKDNEALIADAQSKLAVAILDLDKFIGYRTESANDPLGAVVGVVATLSERGEYRRQLDEISANLKQAESDLEAYRERSSWADRSAKLGYLTPSQARAEATKMSGALDKLAQLQQQKYILTTFTREREFTDLKSKLDVARINYDKTLIQSRAKDHQSDIERRTRQSILSQELEKLKEIDDQIAECRLRSPQDGMVVYYKPESNRFNSSSQGLIAQGEQVKEGQKLLRIPDLHRMQVNTKVHESQVARIRGDDRRSTGIFEKIRAGMLTNTNAFARLISNSEWGLDTVREQFRDKEYEMTSRGMKATVRVDAYPDRIFNGRVKSVAAVSSAGDWMSSEVKVYQTIVIIEETVDGLKPDMNAEVTIHVDDSTEPVLAVPIQAVIGGAESGPKREIFVIPGIGMTPEKREIELGKFNDKMIEVKSGLKENDVILMNPKVLLGNTVKTREDASDGSPSPKGAKGGMGGPGGPGGDKKGGGGKGPGGKGKGGGGAPVI